ncbi:unnamed protein product [Candidula unifasciata]|uniref:Uncharacterized protein n=1 Tax=Candidula unifasciata TaxID=100452 RepID=A0A8S3YWX6_9EUPU|nr:unnamed protein product [Candidula unifasciata]
MFEILLQTARRSRLSEATGQIRGDDVERQFPLAYVILVHKDFEHLERLLRTIYMPQHSICIHVDNKVPDSLKQAVSSLVRCFPNVVLASKPQDIIYAHMSRLLADVVCMQDLVHKDRSWRYLINYAATEFPLRTNLETVKILQALHGLNDIHEQYERRLEQRYKTEFHVIDGRIKQTKIALPPPPFNITIVKGQAYNTFSRAFLEWVFTDEKPRALLEWCNKTYSPDEHYWASLNDLYHNAFLESPGGFKGHPDKKGYITRFISWQYTNPKWKCRGKIVHNICIFSALDLPGLLPEMHLAANKFDLTLDPLAYSCMEELLENRTRAHLPFSLQDYTRLYFVNYKPPSNTSH